MANYYEDLGVSKDATAEEIKKAYRSLAKQCHPDTHAGDKVAEEKFKKITAAYEVLGDEQKRHNYDLYGSAEENPYQNQNYQQYNYSNPFGDETFNAWKRAQQQGYERGYYYSSNNESQDEENRAGNFFRGRHFSSRKECIITFILKIAQVFIAASILPYAVYIFPFGLIFCLLFFVNGLKGIVNSLVSFVRLGKK